MKSLEERVDRLEGGFIQVFKALKHQAEFNKEMTGLLNEVVKFLKGDMERLEKIVELLKDE